MSNRHGTLSSVGRIERTKANLRYVFLKEAGAASARNWMASHRGAFCVAVLAFGLAGLVSVAGPEIRAASRNLLFGPRQYGPHWLSVIFWGGSLFWARLLYLQLVANQQGQDARDKLVYDAMWRAPNPQLFQEYRRFYDTSVQIVAEALVEPSSRPDLGIAIRSVLEVIATMASQFANADEDVSYGANVMLIASPRGDPVKPLFNSVLLENIRFFDRERENLEWLRALLYLPAELAYAANDAHPIHNFNLISLPVPRQVENPKTRKRWALPGGPTALLEGRPSPHADTRNLDLSAYDLHESVKDELREYFGPTGDGAAVRSFLSLRIGRESKSPVGILNIDSDHPNVLGDDRYYPTFYALITPFLSMLEAPVAAYARLLGEEQGGLPSDEESGGEGSAVPSSMGIAESQPD